MTTLNYQIRENAQNSTPRCDKFSPCSSLHNNANNFIENLNLKTPSPEKKLKLEYKYKLTPIRSPIAGSPLLAPICANNFDFDNSQLSLSNGSISSCLFVSPKANSPKNSKLSFDTSGIFSNSYTSVIDTSEDGNLLFDKIIKTKHVPIKARRKLDLSNPDAGIYENSKQSSQCAIATDHIKPPLFTTQRHLDNDPINYFCNCQHIIKKILFHLSDADLREAASVSKTWYVYVNAHFRKSIDLYLANIPDRAENMELNQFGIFRSPMRPNMEAKQWSSPVYRSKNRLLRSPNINKLSKFKTSPIRNTRLIGLSPKTNFRQKMLTNLSNNEKTTVCIQCSWTAKVDLVTNICKCCKCQAKFCFKCGDFINKTHVCVEVGGDLTGLSIVNQKRTKTRSMKKRLSNL